MKEKREIYVLFSCDAHKRFDSMKLITATTSEKTLQTKIRKRLRATDDMEYKGMSGVEAVRAFNADIENGDLNYGNIEYGYIEIMNDGEEL